MKNLLTAIVIALAFAFATPIFNASAATNEGTGPQITMDKAMGGDAMDASAPASEPAATPASHSSSMHHHSTTHHHHTTSSKSSSSTTHHTTTHHHTTTKKPAATTGTDTSTGK